MINYQPSLKICHRILNGLLSRGFIKNLYKYNLIWQCAVFFAYSSALSSFVATICFSKKICPRASCTLPSGVDAPEVTPMTTFLLGSVSRVVRNFSVTISPSTVLCVMVLSAPIQSARLMWKDRMPAWLGISRRCACYAIIDFTTRIHL